MSNINKNNDDDFINVKTKLTRIVNKIKTKSQIGTLILITTLSLITGYNNAIAKQNENEKQILKIYTSRKESLIVNVFEKFEKKYNVKVQYIIDSAPKLVEKIKQEKGKNTADILLTSDLSYMKFAQNKKLLSKIDISHQTKQKYNTHIYVKRKYYWFPVTQRVRWMFYNTKLLQPQKLKNITSYQSLASPELKKQILVRSIKNDYNRFLVASLIQQKGKKYIKNWLDKFVDNLARTPRGGDTDQILAVAQGKASLAIANHYYYLRLLHSKNARRKQVTDIVKPVPLIDKNFTPYANFSAVGLVKGSKKINLARKFIQFLLSDEIQNYFMKTNYEYPVIDNVMQQKYFEPLPKFTLDYREFYKINVKQLKQAVKMGQEAGWK